MMEYYIEVIRNNEFQTSSWPGGTTTQLMIYPKDSRYSDRNFKWRLSSARVNVEESVFTHLPGISRVLMVLEGELTLSHDGKYDAILKPFEQDSFMGDWTTRSFGKATDFNLMLNEGCSGRLNALSIGEGSTLYITPDTNNKNCMYVTNAFYAADGNLRLLINDKEYSINKGDLISITQPVIGQNLEIKLLNTHNSEIMVIEAVIYY